eukprot:CAMPEP_0184497874 /NCGR_PEP_ID=MMETSP0113_2-20130426/37621_1 /TAXON_ID=91329 /ORGANISM="Norrisiella sphaerica, Strain BC52" /LENGTH=288 /DNA_ID=CAMNT_0026885163 /DNA_START=101 /DNA_END=967 /DNA_ORIENTATION=+
MPELIDAVKSGNECMVEDALDHSTSWEFREDETDEYGSTALILGSRAGMTEVVEAILDQSPPPWYLNAQNVFGSSALMCAAANGNTDIAAILLDAKVDVNVQSRYGSSALSKAAVAGHGEIVKKLLESGAQTDVVNAVGKSIATLAKEMGQDDISKMLESHVGKTANPGEKRENDRAKQSSSAPVEGVVRMLRQGGGMVELKGAKGDVFVPGIVRLNELVHVKKVENDEWELVTHEVEASLDAGDKIRTKAAKIKCIHPYRPLGRQCHDCPRRDTPEYKRAMAKAGRR